MSLRPTPARRRRDTACVIVAAMLLLAGTPSFGASIEIANPRPMSTVLGPTKVALRLVDVDESLIERLVVRVDGEVVASVTQPPWEAVFDAGDGSTGHVIEAILALSDGSRLRSSVRTTPLRINESMRVNLVNLYPLVFDRGGKYVSGLTAGDFRVSEDGQPQVIERFTTRQRPIRVAIVIDTSLSMTKGGRLDNAKKAALGFLDVLGEQDDALVVAFADRVEIIQDVTKDRTRMVEAIASTRANGGTALYDAIWRTSKRLEGFDGRRVMVLLSDGRDEAANGFEPGSLHTLGEAQEQAVRSEVMIFAIGLGRNLDQEYAREWTRSTSLDAPGGRISLEQILESLAVNSGGRLLLTHSPTKLRRAFAAVAEDLRNQYSLAYEPTNSARDGRFRRIELTVPGRDVEVVVRKGYYAPEEDEADAR